VGTENEETENEESGDIQEPAQAVDFEALDLDEEDFVGKTSVSCNIAAL
jgi:hypothetical protein